MQQNLLTTRIDSEDANFVHVREFGNHQHKHSKCVEEKHRMLVVSCMRGYQVPVEN